MSAWTTDVDQSMGEWHWFKEDGGFLVVVFVHPDLQGRIVANFTNGRREAVVNLRGEWQPVEPAKE